MTVPPTSMPNEAENKRAPDLVSTRTLMKELHAGQTDLEGQPYAFHPMRVARNVRLLDPNASDEVLMAALLHDTIEDCGIDEGFLRAKGFTDDTIKMVSLVTKPEGDPRSYAEVIEDLIASGNRGAMIAKLADNMDNLHPQRVAALKAKNPDKAEKLKARYMAAIQNLSSAAGLDAKHVFQLIEASAPLQLGDEDE